jgi:hypothetical protein
MEGRRHGHAGQLTGGALAALLMLATLPAVGAAAAGPADLLPLPDCAALPASSPDAEITSPWQVVLDESGVVVGHRLTLRRGAAAVTVRVGRRGFSLTPGADRLLVGERTAEATSLAMLDTKRGCRTWARTLDGLAYEAEQGSDGRLFRLGVVDPLTRFFEGQAILEVDSGATVALIEGECGATCEPNDGQVALADFLPAGAARPVPAFPAGGWQRDTGLPFGWLAGAVPPDWARPPVVNGAADASGTSASRSPQFSFRSGASDTIRYTSQFPGFCRYGIACASRDMPASWAVWLRPHGTDFSWGTLRWCQREDSAGCFDLRRVVIHELGHVAGLDHPSSAGFNLAADETVMHAITPARPSPGSSRHAFGRCDVATLQELYDVPSNDTPISSCNDVPTNLSLSTSTAVLMPGQSVRLQAELQVSNLASLGLLAGNPLNDRSVKLKYRRAGSEDAWTVLWMQALGRGGAYELNIAPQTSWEFVASFPAPADEGLRYSTSDTLKVRVNK